MHVLVDDGLPLTLGAYPVRRLAATTQRDADSQVHIEVLIHFHQGFWGIDLGLLGRQGSHGALNLSGVPKRLSLRSSDSRFFEFRPECYVVYWACSPAENKEPGTIAAIVSNRLLLPPLGSASMKNRPASRSRVLRLTIRGFRVLELQGSGIEGCLLQG